jgi:hypothetical protein
MAHKELIIALGMIVATAPLSAAQTDVPTQPAPAAGPDAKYCLRVELTGNIVEPVRCWTRDKWAEQGVDVDKEWAKDGVRVIG